MINWTQQSTLHLSKVRCVQGCEKRHFSRPTLLFFVAQLLLLLLLLLFPALALAQHGPSGISSSLFTDTYARAAATDACSVATSGLGTNYCGGPYNWHVQSGNAFVYTSATQQLAYVTGSAVASLGNDQYAAWHYGNGLFNNINSGVAIRSNSQINSSTTAYTAYCTTVSGSNCTQIVANYWHSSTNTNLLTINGTWAYSSSYFALSASSSSICLWLNGSYLTGSSGTSCATDTHLTSGTAGLWAGLGSGATYGNIGYLEVGNITTPPNPPNVVSTSGSVTVSGAFPFQFGITINNCSGGTIYYTTDGTTPTHSSSVYSASFNSVSSGSGTVEAICNTSNGDSTVTTASYSISAPSDVSILTDNFSSLEDANLEPNHNQQRPLDKVSALVRGAWQALGGISGDVKAQYEIPSAAIAPVRSGYIAPVTAGNAVAGGYSSTYELAASISRTGYSDSQFAAGKLPTPLSTNAQGGVMTNGSLSAKTGYYFIAYCALDGSATSLWEFGYFSAGTKTVLASASSQTMACGQSIKLRKSGSWFQLLIGGSTPPGASQLSYYDTTITGGYPGVAVSNGGAVSDFSAGNVGVADGTSSNSYTPSYPNYTDNFGSSWGVYWPWLQARDNAVVSGAPTPPIWSSVPTPILTGGSYYSLGVTENSGSGTISYRGGEFGANQWQIVQIESEPTTIKQGNDFAPLQLQVYIQGTSGGCATAGTQGSCFDNVAYYPGVEYVGSSRGAIGTSISTIGKAEYYATPFWHITKVTPTASPGNQVVTVAGSPYTLRPGDLAYEEYVAPYLNVACKGTSSNRSSWQANHAYSVGDYIIDPQYGNWQVVVTAGTSGSSAPTFGEIWGYSDPSLGQFTNDGAGALKWMYAGLPCPSTTHYSWIINATDSDLAGLPGTPALWFGGAPIGSGGSGPVFSHWQAGTATSNTACALDSNLCGLLEQPHPWTPMARRVEITNGMLATIRRMQ